MSRQRGDSVSSTYAFGILLYSEIQNVVGMVEELLLLESNYFQ